MKKVIGSALVAATTFATTAYAEVPAEVTTQIESVKADIATVGAAIVVLAAVAMGFRWLKAQFF